MIPNFIPLFAGLLLLLQTAPTPLGDATSITHTVTELTLTGALIIAVKVLWESNKKKDEQVLTMATRVTETMALVMRAVEELRVTTNELGSGLDNLSSQIAALEGALSPHGKL